VEVASLKDAGPVGTQLASAGVDVTALNARSPLSFPRVVTRLRRLIRDRQIDTVLSFLVHANVVASLGVPRGVRHFQSIQTTQPRPKWHWTAQQFASRNAERVIVPSPSVARIAQERSAIPSDLFVVIPNAIDPVSFPLSSIAREPPNEFPVGFIGRLDPVKRIPDLIDAMTRLGKRASLHIFGDGPEREKIERLGKKADRVVMHGAIPDPREALSRMALLVLPSEAEGFGLVLIEAMAAGVPVVATRAPGIVDVVRHEENGLLVPVGDPKELAKAIERIIEDRALRVRLIENGLRTVREKYTWDVVLPQYRALLGI
jgi:glycosyltransferase involved in cell wall biosynthesis